MSYIHELYMFIFNIGCMHSIDAKSINSKHNICIRLYKAAQPNLEPFDTYQNPLYLKASN